MATIRHPKKIATPAAAAGTDPRTRAEAAAPAPFATGARDERLAPAGSESPAPDSPAAGPKPRLKVEVEWASIAQTTGDAYVVGHYIGVVPQNAERVLDRALSGVGTEHGPSEGVDEAGLILTDLTRRGAIRGALGDIIFFPWNGKGQIVLAGMGRLGTFKEPQLWTLAASFTQSIARLIPNPTICTVLIGAGFGNLTVGAAVSGLIGGVSRTLESEPRLQSVTLRIVEYRLDRAYEILSEVRSAKERLAPDVAVDITSADSVIERDDTGGAIPIPFGFSMMLASLAQACFDGTPSPLASSVDALTDQLPEKLRVPVRAALKGLGKQRNTRQLGLAFRIVDDEAPGASTIADRISFSHDGARIQAAAITNLTTVAATTKEVSLSWIDRFVESLRAPAVAVYQDRGRKALQTLVHPSLQEKLLLTGPLVLELDRTMARVPWELVHQRPEQPLAVLRPMARQLRTAYSPRPSDLVIRTKWKALVIGDPDGSLPASVAEAKAVAATLEASSVETTLRIGPPDVLGLGSQRDIEPADLYEILELLQTGDYDIVHYAGHAHFLSDYPDRSGWVFKDGEILTASKLEGVDRAPRLIVANACVSANLSTQIPTRPVAAGIAAPASASSDSGVVASLADEFFRRGVADYIGTAWEVAELPATIFAQVLYKEFFAGWKPADQGNVAPSTQLGTAVQMARTDLFSRSAEFTAGPTVWAAYQHYGDPTRTLADYRA